MTDDSPRAWLTEESLDQTVDELLELAAQRGRQLRELQGNEPSEASQLPGIDLQLRRALRRSLEDEIVPVSQGRDGEIDAYEVEHEIIKKALVGMKMSALREAARDEGVATSGVAEDVATRVAQAHDWDAQEIARLVLRYEEEPAAERGHVTRIFPMGDPIDVDYAHDRLTVVAGRYIRVGVARWFVFDTVARREDQIEVSGSYRAYRATVDEEAGQPVLTSVPGREPLRASLSASASLEIHGGGMQGARAAARALALVVASPLRGYVPNAEMVDNVAFGGVHPTSEFMLDLLSTRLRDAGLYNRDLTVARFKVADDDLNTPTVDEGDRRPVLKAVRFEGKHLLDSIAACRLLATERRPLPEIALQASFQPLEGQHFSTRLPIKISIERDHVLVATGLGTDPAISSDVHGRVLTSVEQEIESGTADAESLAELVSRIMARAQEVDMPATATMLTD